MNLSRLGPIARIRRSVGMPLNMQLRAVDCADEAIEKHEDVRDIAHAIRRMFETLHSPPWRCFVDRNYELLPTTHGEQMVCIYLKGYNILLVKPEVD